jgi:hypothetical protein
VGLALLCLFGVGSDLRELMVWAGRSIRRALVLGTTCLGLLVPLGIAGAGGAAAATASGSPAALGKAWQAPKGPAPDSSLPTVGAGQQASTAQTAENAALKQARATGKAQVVGSLTTGTTLVTAEPDGELSASENVLPVRVKRGADWLAVSTRLALGTGGRLSPAAVPGDTVSFSDGGTSPMAEIAASGTSLSLRWPGRLPKPTVSGPSAVYRNVLPGVNLVLTATSVQAGGFSEVLVVGSRTAARDPGLARLSLRVTTSGTGALRTAAGGGLTAEMTKGRGSFTAGAPQMWDSSSVLAGAATAKVRAAGTSAREADATLAPAGAGPSSSSAGPAGGALLAAVRAGVSGNGSLLSLTPDARMLAASSTRFPVYIAPSFTVDTTETADTGGFTDPNKSGDKQDFDPVQSDPGTGSCNGTTGACDTTDCQHSHYNDDTTPYSVGLPVGYDDFEDGACQFKDTDYALYQIAIPTGTPGPFGPQAVIMRASFQVKEVYSSSCSADPNVEASWINGMGSSTGWPGPGIASGNTTSTDAIPADTGSCNSTEDTSDQVAEGFNLTPDLNAMSGTPASITVRLWESGDTTSADHKQFTNNPTLDVFWTDTPNAPSGLGETAVSGGGSMDCVQSATGAPHIGETDSNSGLNLNAKYSDPDGAAVQGNIEYKVSASSSWTVVNDAVASDNGTLLGYELPSSILSKLAVGTVMEWAAQAETGVGTALFGANWGPYYGPETASGGASWTSPCYFVVYPKGPDAPTMTGPSGFASGTPETVGSTVQFTITQASTGPVDPPSEFVWGFDQTPPTSGTIPAAQTCSTTVAESNCTEMTKNSSGLETATVSIKVPSPGPHDLWVYAVDSAGNQSGTTNGATSGYSWTFTGAADPAATFTGGPTLQANFADAVGANQPFDNVMISTQAGAPGNGVADGENAFDEAELKSYGWEPGGGLTVDGATFTLPSFGTTADTADNLLAAGQVISTGSTGAAGSTAAQGSSLVFLATSTSTNVQVAGAAGTGAGDSVAYVGDPTAPSTAVGYPVTGSGCAGFISINTTVGSCNPATGTVNYYTDGGNNGCPASTAYTLAVPDWVSGPSDIAAAVFPSRDHPGGQQDDSPKVYAFAVPIDPSCTVTSIALPDVSGSVLATVGTGLTEAPPSLHILGMALRNTTTADPAVGTTVDGAGTQQSPATPAGQAWTGAFESPIEDAFYPPSGDTWGDQTIRIAASPNVSAPAGAQIRIRLSNPGYWSDDGTGPLTIGAVTIAPRISGAVPQPNTMQTLTFGGSNSASIPVGGDIYSDPLTLNFPVTAGKDLLVSLYVENASLPTLPLNSYPSGGMAWFASSATPNETGDTTGTPFTSAGGYSLYSVPILTGVDVTTPAEVIDSDNSAQPPTQFPGEPTVVVAGDNVIDGSAASAQQDGPDAPSLRLGGYLAGDLTQLAATEQASGDNAPLYGVVDAGVPSNLVTSDGSYYGNGADSPGVPGGESLVGRLDRDILAEPGVGTVIVDEGLEDMLWDDGATNDQTLLQDDYDIIQEQLEAFGVQSYFGTLTPCGGYSDSKTGTACNSATESARIAVNSGISKLPGSCSDIDFSGALAQPGTSGPVDLATADNIGDDVNLTQSSAGGYAALAQAVISTATNPLSPCPIVPVTPQAPETS